MATFSDYISLCIPPKMKSAFSTLRWSLLIFSWSEVSLTKLLSLPWIKNRWQQTKNWPIKKCFEVSMKVNQVDQCLQRFAHFGLIPGSDPHHSRLDGRAAERLRDTLIQERFYTRNILGAHLPPNYYWNIFFIKYFISINIKISNC